jgi:hypothetical protein
MKDRPLPPPIESLLRGAARVEPPRSLEARVLAAYDRGERVAPPLAPVLSWTRLAPFAAAAAVLAIVGVATFSGSRDAGRRPGPRNDLAFGAGSLSPWRVVDDPNLGLARGRESAEAALADLVDGP